LFLFLFSFKGEKEITDEDIRIQILEVNKEKGLYEMILPNVKQEDAGEYRVIASNKYSEESCSCHVSVTSKQFLYIIDKVKYFYNHIYLFR